MSFADICTESEITFEPASYEEVKPFILENHYAHRIPSISYAFKAKFNGMIFGICTFGKPASNSLCKGVCGDEYKSYVIELNRLWMSDLVPKNTTSQFVAYCLRNIGDKIVVSYADTGMNHVGTIYQALNFLYTGKTKKRTDIYTGSNTHSRHYDKDTDKSWRIVRTPKYRYILFVGNRRFKKTVNRQLRYNVEPYPKGKSKRYSIGDSKKETIYKKEEE